MKISPSLGYFSLLCILACSSDPEPGGDGSGGGFVGQAGSSGAPSGGVAGSPVGVAGAPQAGIAGSPTAGAANGGQSSGAGGVSAGAGQGGKSMGGGGSGGSAGAIGGSGTGGASAGTSSGGSSGASAGAGGSVSAGSGGGGGDPLAVYASLCASCHGAKGEGVAMMGPEIQHPVRDFSTWVVRNGRMGHPSFSKSTMLAFNQTVLPDATLNAIFDSLSTPAIPKPTTGAALYADYCATCHGATGAGGPAAHDAKGEPLSKALSMVRSGHSLTQFSSRTGYMPKWSAAELSDAEVGLIVDYLDSL